MIDNRPKKRVSRSADYQPQYTRDTVGHIKFILGDKEYVENTEINTIIKELFKENRKVTENEVLISIVRPQQLQEVFDAISNE
jgi:hypothetical protein